MQEKTEGSMKVRLGTRRRVVGPKASASLDRPARRPQSMSGMAWLALAVVYIVWGSTYLGIRIAVETLPPLLSAAARFITAGAMLIAVLAWRRGTAALYVTPRQLASAALIGLLLLTGGNGLAFLAETQLPSGLTALLVALTPVWMILLRVGSGYRPSVMAFVGVGLGVLGLLVLTAPGLSGRTAVTGVIVMVAGTLLWALGSVLSSRISLPGDVFVATAYEMVTGGIGCLLLAILHDEPSSFHLHAVSGRSWAALAYLVVFGSLGAFTCYVWLLQAAPLSVVSTYAYINPVVAVILGALVLHEPLTRNLIIGGSVIVAAVVSIVTGERHRSR
ncbi:EamA family transporter [Kitasatospora sp. HPMI-4]|uniref:EamA family transporter n=1 Tax=Kitasatospora sp. HPMI-4 TaxID=3448443 RepID=UPI003F1A06FF